MKDIIGYEGLYAITEQGQVWSYRAHRFLKPFDNGAGYPIVALYKNKVGTQLLVHRLVAEAYIPNPDNLPLVNHKDENPNNPDVSNLEWCTYRYNSIYGTANERRAVAHKGKKHSEEHKQNQSKALMGHKVDEATRKKISEARKGMKFSEEHKRKISESMKKKKI